MSTPHEPRPPWLGRILLRLRRLGDRRAEIEADLRELFHLRSAERGRMYAAFRHCVDALSLWIRRRERVAGPVQEQVPRASASSIDGLLLDMRFGVRMLRRRPGIVSVTVVGLALAVAVSTVVFGLTQAIFLRVDIPDPSSAFELQRAYADGGSRSGFWLADYRQIREAVDSAKLEAYTDRRVPFGESNPEEVKLALVSGGFFETLRIRASLGRVLTKQDDTPTATPAVVVNHAFWEHRLGGDEASVGRTVQLMGTGFTVVGVLNQDFVGVPGGGAPAFWAPVATHDRVSQPQPERDIGMLVFGRIAKDATREQAEDEISAAVTGVFSDTEEDEPAIVGARLQPVDDPFSGPGGTTLRWIVGTIAVILGFVLLLACTNVANLLLANAVSRRREVGVRLALGATRGRIVRQLLTESLMLGVLSGGLGLLFAFWLLSAADTILGLPWTIPMTPDLRVFGFAVVFALLAGLGAGLAPARYGTRGDLAAPLKGAAADVHRSRRPGRARSLLVGVQAAASTALLILAALLTRTVVHAAQYDLGIDVEQLIAVTPSLDEAGYDVPRAADYWNRILERVEELPGVENAALVSQVPLAGTYSRVERLQRAGEQISVYFNHTSAEYFATAGIPVLQGRTYTAHEVVTGAPVAVISEGLARKLWKGEEVLGATMERVAEDLSETRVVGIVGHAPLRVAALDAGMVYRPVVWGDGRGSLLRSELLVRTVGNAETALQPVQEAVRAIDPEAVPMATLVRDGLEDRLRWLRMNATIGATLGAVALGLACLGIFSVTAFSVEQRTGEIGVRRAVGASMGDVFRLMLQDSLRPVLAGLVVGLLGALWGGRVLTAVLYGVSPHDPMAILGAVAVLLVAAALAAGVATRRATRVDPVAVLEGN